MRLPALFALFCLLCTQGAYADGIQHKVFNTPDSLKTKTIKKATAQTEEEEKAGLEEEKEIQNVRPWNWAKYQELAAGNLGRDMKAREKAQIEDIKKQQGQRPEIMDEPMESPPTGMGSIISAYQDGKDARRGMKSLTITHSDKFMAEKKDAAAEKTQAEEN